MGKVLLTEYTARNQDGRALPGLALHCYPYTTMANDADITDNLDGTYTIKHDPAVIGDGRIARYYDIYVGVTMKIEKVPIGDAWIWLPVLAVDVTPKVVNFNALLDENGDALPATILNAKVEIMYAETDRAFFISALNDNGFTIQASAVGGALLPVNVHLKVFTGEA